MACNPKEYDRKGGVIVYTCSIKKMELVQDMSGCRENQKVKYTTGSLIGKPLGREEFCPNNEMQKLETEFLVTPWLELAMLRTLIDSMSFLATEPTTIQSVILKAGMLTVEAIRNGALKKIRLAKTQIE
ncbi:hypothetical protein Tco_1222192 [Tanacetum coccineum]